MTSGEETFGKYTLLERIDVGGMAEVFLAKLTGAEGFERTVAIKRILPEVAQDENFVRMFIDEAKIASRLQHPNIAQIFDLGREGDDLFIALEYVHGKDLRTLWSAYRARRQRFPLALACHVGLQVAEALQHAHFAEGPGGKPLGLIHRDVSPQNVLLSFEGDVKVIDFGLAKAAGRAVQTATGVVKGKLAYMSPEQARGEKIDLRSDVYALGIVLWELVAGERLFSGQTDVETILRVQRGVVPSPRRHFPELAEDLERVIGLALQRDLDDRYQSAQELHDDLQAYVLGSGLRMGADGVAEILRGLFPDDFAKHAPRTGPLAAPRRRPPPPAAAASPPSGPTTLPDAPTFDDITTTEHPAEGQTLETRVDDDEISTMIPTPKRR